MRTSRLSTFGIVAFVMATLILSASTIPVTASQVSSTPSSRNLKAGEEDAGEFIYDVATYAYEGAVAGAVGGIGGLPVGVEAGAILGFYAGAAAGAIHYFFSNDGYIWELTSLPKGRLPAKILD